MRDAENCKGSNRQPRSPRKKRTEPFVLIDSEVLNSPAYLDLSFSARSMLLEVLHFHNGRNNGSIWITKRVLEERGFSKNTATKALKELRSHGFLFMTKKGGNIAGGCSWHAITWLPINRVEGQILDNLVFKAYKNWKPSEINDRSEFGTALTQKVGLINLSTLAQ